MTFGWPKGIVDMTAEVSMARRSQPFESGGKSVPDNGKGICKASEAGTELVCARDRRNGIVARA